MKNIVAGALLALSTAGNAAVVVTYELPGVQTTTAAFDYVGVETFDGRPTGLGQNFTTDFGTTGQSTVITGAYSEVQINPADVYGAAGGVGNYAVAFSNDPYELTLSTSDPKGVTYFGYWLSALDANNRLDFYQGSQLLYTFTPTAVLNAIGGNPAYFGNPTAPFQGGNGGEPYSFVNVYFTNGESFDRVRFYQVGGGGYESDNHTVGFFTNIGGIGVPEPATWAMMIGGFGLVGSALRRRRGDVVAA